MNCIDEAEFRKRLKSGLSGAFMFFGDEDYLKAYCIKAARQAILPDESLACFNDITIDFPDYSADRLADVLAAPPMMSECKVVTLRSFNFRALKPSEIDAFCETVSPFAGDKSNLLIISVIPDGVDVGYLPKRPSALFGKLSNVLTPVSFEQSTPAKLAFWVARHFKQYEVSISEPTARFLIDYCGKSMFSLASEIEKLAAYAKATGASVITEEHIRYVAVPAEDCDSFALSNAAMRGDRQGALSVLSVMKNRRIKPEFIMSELSQLYSHLFITKTLLECGVSPADIAAILKPHKVHEYTVGLYIKAARGVDKARLRRALSLCADADLAMKTYGKRDYEQIEKLVCLI